MAACRQAGQGAVRRRAEVSKPQLNKGITHPLLRNFGLGAPDKERPASQLVEGQLTEPRELIQALQKSVSVGAGSSVVIAPCSAGKPQGLAHRTLALHRCSSGWRRRRHMPSDGRLELNEPGINAGLRLPLSRLTTSVVPTLTPGSPSKKTRSESVARRPRRSVG
jgi:hypothetical protein